MAFVSLACNSIENNGKSDTLGGGDGRSVMNFKMSTGCAGDSVLLKSNVLLVQEGPSG